ncbi:Sentrin-specific protease 7 [Oryzias melastigma]|uniref:Sentrin-specific protease 7 n=1 Tax=Oryzias melastigma TaxID=30732 RepID=A0A834FNQ3_ORYME|nr:Sentrin-specific protease 7 [Oryzias melastigma]
MRTVEGDFEAFPDLGRTEPSFNPVRNIDPNLRSFPGYGDSSSRGRLDSQHRGALSPAAGRDRPLFREVVKTLLGLNSPNEGGVSAANHRPPASWSCQSQAGGWRPKRASDRLLPPDKSQPLHQPQRTGGAGVSLPLKNTSVDSLAELRAEGHAGSWGSDSLQTGGESTKDTDDSKINSGKPQNHCQSSGPTTISEDWATSPTRTRIKIRLSAASPLSDVRQTPPSVERSSGRRSLDVPRQDVMEDQRDRWKRFREGRSSVSRPKKPRVTPAEPIVLSSEEEEESGRRGLRGRGGGSAAQRPLPPVSPPSFLQLQFTSLHAGLMHAHANGAATITEDSITLPVKGADEGQLVVVASQVCGYGVWDGGVAHSGTLLASWEGPAPSLLFLWVSNAQANLLHRELSAIRTLGGATGPSCCILLLVLKEQLQELQAALLASILELQSYQQGRSSHGGPASPLDWAEGLTLVHSCPSPVDRHLLRLLGRLAGSDQLRSSQKNKSKPGLSDLPSRLIQYPVSPCKGRITVSLEDLACLHAGEFLNDVIIDFYLKYLVLEGVANAVAERTHIFSSFFFKQLSRRHTAGEEEEDCAPSVPDRRRRHQRVKTWTRHLDIFTKDFLFVPVNQASHWFLVVICFPGLEEPRQDQHQTPLSPGKVVGLRSAPPPECTLEGCNRRTVMKRPCILVMDSLRMSSHDGVCRLLRDYLQVEWEMRRRTPRLFSVDTMKGYSCRVPQQGNSSDCGVFLLQFAQSFLQNPVVNFDLPPRLENWFPQQQVRQKREEIRSLILKLHQNQLSHE